MKKTPQKNQAGFVSTFTVLFFMILIMVITVGFLRIVVQEQQQSTDNSSSASALAAAKAGIEDGKRALALYNDPATDAGLRDTLSSAFKSGNCEAIFGNSAIASSLKLSREGVVSNAHNQKYTCLTVDTETSDYVGSAVPMKSVIVPLRSVGDIKKLSLSWNRTQGENANPLTADMGVANGKLPSQSEWQSQKRPAFPRLQLYSVPKSIADANSIRSQVIFLQGGKLAGSENPTVTFSDDASSPRPVGCATGSTDLYSCRTTLQGGLLDEGSTADRDLYLRVTMYYGGSDFSLQMKNANNEVVNFDMIQPKIDSTGNTATAFRRVQARVTLGGETNLPEFVVQADGGICKRIVMKEKVETYATSQYPAGCYNESTY